MGRLRFLGKIPHRVALACSGGVDSMAVLDFLLRGKKEVVVLNVDHGTEYGKEAAKFVINYCNERGIEWICNELSDLKMDKSLSLEANWHDARYAFFRKVHKSLGIPILTCHHLDDQVENWIMTAATGNPVLIPYQNKSAGVIRPFLLTRKDSFYSWCERKSVPFMEDPSNKDVKYTRNLVRHEVVPAMLKVNPGLHKVVARMIRNKYNESM